MCFGEMVGFVGELWDYLRGRIFEFVFGRIFCGVLGWFY